MIGPTPTERVFSFTLALLIQIGFGAALLASAQTGKPRPGDPSRKHEAITVITLLPIDGAEARPHASQPSVQPPAPPAPSEALDGGLATARAKVREHRPPADPVPDKKSSVADAAGSPARTHLPTNEALSWRTRVQSHLAAHRIYPAAAIDSHDQGVVLVQFTVDRHGNVTNVWIAMSSGTSAIDRETIAAILRAQPLPSFPPGWPDTVDLKLPVAYRLG